MIINLGKLTEEQREFAAKYHYLVENFLKFRRLDRDEYYDIIIFGFIRAVRKYFIHQELQIYSFSTIAIYAMKSDLFNHYRKQRRKMRNAVVVSLDAPAYDDSDITIGDTVAAPGSISDYIDSEILWNDITLNIPDEYAEILRMKSDGYNNREIAKKRSISVKDIDSMIEQIRETVGSMRPV
ncbi:MAG: hypothetical protein FWD71_08460 [Oscillospiraceae bacterium]|nr:hypothetical protein [Oscillospiraceae bacterium]